MARSSLFQNKKFKRLVALLGIPRPQVVGLLETMWHACYETGNPVFSELEEIEAAAEWWGEPTAFAKCALQTRMIDRNTDGTFQVHDFWDHAPKGAVSRRDREQARKPLRICDECNLEFHSGDPRTKFCSDACRQKNYRDRSAKRVTERVTDVTDRYTTPDTRHPTPDTRNTKPSSSRVRACEAGPDRAARRRGPVEAGDTNRPLGDEPGKDKPQPLGDEAGPAAIRSHGDETGSGPRATGERRRARNGTNGDESHHRETLQEGEGDDEADGHAGDRTDREIRAFIGRHPMLTYDLRTHGQVRKLVEIAGWPRATELIDRGVRSGARFPAGWAVGVLANEEQAVAARTAANGQARPTRFSATDERAEATAAGAIAELRAESEGKS